MAEERLLLISRDDILAFSGGKEEERLYRLLGRLTRAHFQFLATAPLPEPWTRQDGRQLAGAGSIRQRLEDTGGVLDGIYFVPRSLFTQKRNRIDALHDILQRYAMEPANCFLYSSSLKFVQAAQSIGIKATHLTERGKLSEELRKLLKKPMD